MRGLEPGQRLGDEVVRVVEELLDSRNIRAAHLVLSSYTWAGVSYASARSGSVTAARIGRSTIRGFATQS